MAENDISLLFRLRAEASGVQAGTSQAAAAVTQLRTRFGSELGQMTQASHGAFHELSKHISEYVSESLPAIGPLHIRLVEHLHGITEEAKTVSPELKKVTASIADLSQVSGKSTSEVASFLKTYIGIKSVSEQNAAAVQFFGGKMNAFSGEVAANFTPQLKNAESEMVALGSESENTGGILAAVAAGPLAIITIAILAAIAAEYEFIKSSIEAADNFAEFGGEMERASLKTGLTIEQLTGLRVLADENKVSFEQLTTGFARYLKNVQSAKDGNKALADQFKQLGVDIDSLSSPEEAIRELFKAIEREGPDAFARNETAIKLLSRAGIDLIPVLIKMGGELDNATSKGKNLLGFTEADAKAAAELEEKTADLKNAVLGLSLAFGKAAAPEVLQFSKELTDTIVKNRESITALLGVTGIVLKLIEGPLLEALDTTNTILILTKPAVDGASNALHVLGEGYDYVAAAARAAAEAIGLEHAAQIDAKSIPAIEGTGVGPDKLPTDAEKAKKAAEDNVSTLKAASAEAKRIAADAIAEQEKLFKLGQQNRETETANIIAKLQVRAEADKAAIKAEITRKYQEIRDLDKADAERPKKIAALAEQITDLNQQLADKDSEVARDAEKRRTDDQIAERNGLLAHQKTKAEILIAAGQTRIKAITEEVHLGVTTAADGEKEREQIENAAFKRRDDLLKLELHNAGANLEEGRKIKDARKALEQEYTANLEEQKRRQAKIREDEAKQHIQLAQLEREGVEKVRDIGDKNETQRLQAEVSHRIRSAEDAARQITAIELAANSRAQRELKAQIKEVPDEIKDPAQRALKLTQLNNRLKELENEQTGIELKGEADREAGHQQDLDNLQKYVDAYLTLRDIELTIDREIEQLKLSLMRTTHASQLAILNQELADRTAAETRRNAAELRRIDHERDVALKAAKGLEDEKQKIDQITLKHDLLLEKEKKRHDAAMGLITAEGKAGKGDINKSPASAFDQLGTAINENLSGAKLTAATAGLQAMSTVFSQLGQAVGSVVQSFVLYGTAGTSVRKVTAEILASVAQQAAVKAVFELAEGFAALALAYFGIPNAGPSAAAHFTAAAVYAAIAGVAAVVGRGVAGDAFKQGSGGGGGGGGASGSGSSGSNGTTKPSGPTIINAERNVIHLELSFKHEPGGLFHTEVAKSVVKNINGNGIVRAAIKREK